MRRFSVLFAIAATVVMVSVSSAHAVPGLAAAAVVGGGSISPGLTATPTFQSGNFSGTAAGAGANASGDVFVGQLNCNFNFASIIAETSAHGAGLADGNCAGVGVNGTAGNVSCNLLYVRIGGVVIVVTTPFATVVVTTVPRTICVSTWGANSTTGELAGGFLFAPTSAPGAPVTSYALVGAAAGAGL